MNDEKMGNIYQIVLLLLVGGMLVYKLIVSNEVDQTMLGAIIGLMVGIPAVKKMQ